MPLGTFLLSMYQADSFSEKMTHHMASITQASQPAKLQKKQCGGVYFCVYGTAFSMPIPQKLSPPVLLFSDFAGWVEFYDSK